MCDPVIAGSVINGAAQVATLMGEQGQAKQAQAQFDAMQVRTNTAAGEEMAQARLRQRQEKEAVIADVIAAEERARKATASAQVSAAEAGVVGPSVDAFVAEFAKVELEHRFRGEKQLDAIDDAADANDLAYRRQVKERLIGATPTPSSSGFLDLGLGLAGLGARTYTKFSDTKNPETK